MHWKINYRQNIKSFKLNNIPSEFLFKDRMNIIAKITSSNDKIWINNYLGSINIMFHNFIPVNLFTLRTRNNPKTITYDEHRSKTRSCSISYSNIIVIMNFTFLTSHIWLLPPVHLKMTTLSPCPRLVQTSCPTSHSHNYSPCTPNLLF